MTPMTPKGTCRPALAAGTVVEALREHHLQRFSLIVGLLPRHASWNLPFPTRVNISCSGRWRWHVTQGSAYVRTSERSAGKAAETVSTGSRKLTRV